MTLYMPKTSSNRGAAARTARTFSVRAKIIPFCFRKENGVDAALVKIVSRFFFGQTPIMTSFMGIFITCFLTVCNMVNAQGTFQFRADIRGANEVPPVITWLTGFGRMTLDGNIFTASVFLVPPSSTNRWVYQWPCRPRFNGTHDF